MALFQYNKAQAIVIHFEKLILRMLSSTILRIWSDF